ADLGRQDGKRRDRERLDGRLPHRLVQIALREVEGGDLRRRLRQQRAARCGGLHPDHRDLLPVECGGLPRAASPSRRERAMSDKGLVVITGASSGFGEATAVAFAKLGHPLALGARRVEKLQEVAKTCARAGSPDARALELDVTSLSSIQRFAERAGTPEILINNAGMARGRDPIDKLRDEDIVAMVDTNVTGLFRVTRAFLPGMIARKKGHVVNVGSLAAHGVYEGGVVYCPTKHAVRAISQAMRLELAGTNPSVTE